MVKDQTETSNNFYYGFQYFVQCSQERIISYIGIPPAHSLYRQNHEVINTERHLDFSGFFPKIRKGTWFVGFVKRNIFDEQRSFREESHKAANKCKDIIQDIQKNHGGISDDT